MRSIETAPQLYAHLGGALYLVIILFGDAAATAPNIVGAPLLWQGNVMANLLVVLCAVPLLWIEYLLLRPVSKNLVLLAVLLNLVSLAVEAMSKVFLLMVMPTLAEAESLHGLGTQQGPLLASFALRAHAISFNVALLFFGGTCLVNGYLIFKSGYLPRVIGILMQVAGGCYRIACWVALFSLALSQMLLPTLLLPSLLGESSLCLWLLVKGVDSA
ncbi:MAG TPA: DUF4386 domain-containing protein, partial [Hymenobacter sp.]|nr:DUF4386 domain-containing protein [Hymenobacter sp.]